MKDGGRLILFFKDVLDFLPEKCLFPYVSSKNE